MNYFEFYRLPISFHLDPGALRRVYYEHSRKFHPDFHTQSGENEQAEMLEQSSLNNEAYKTLSDPDRRMRYILEINGLLGEESQQPPLPQDFLMEMMDINEALMELEFEPDPARYAATLQAVARLENELETAIQPALAAFEKSRDPGTLTAVRDFYLKKRYLLRIRENLSKFATAS